MNQQQERNWAMLCHLSALLGLIIPFASLVAPLIMWQMKKNESEYVDYHGKEAVNFQLSLLIYSIIAAVLVLLVIGIFLIWVLIIYSLIIVIIAGIKANDGEYYQYPLTIRLIK